MSTKPTLDDVYLADEDTEGDCAVCGDEIEVGERIVWAPAGYGPTNAIVCEHLWCAVRGGEIDLTGTCVEWYMRRVGGGLTWTSATASTPHARTRATCRTGRTLGTDAATRSSVTTTSPTKR